MCCDWRCRSTITLTWIPSVHNIDCNYDKFIGLLVPLIFEWALCFTIWKFYPLYFISRMVLWYPKNVALFNSCFFTVEKYYLLRTDVFFQMAQICSINRGFPINKGALNLGLSLYIYIHIYIHI